MDCSDPLVTVLMCHQSGQTKTPMAAPSATGTAIKRPPAGACFPAEYVRCRDADTVEVSIFGGSIVLPIRLLRCYAPELKTPLGAEAKRIAEKALLASEQLYIFIPRIGTNKPLKHFTFDRILGHIFLDETLTLSDLLVSLNLASSGKRKPLGR
jgi:hypothetical protein